MVNISRRTSQACGMTDSKKKLTLRIRLQGKGADTFGRPVKKEYETMC
jgi:hypothetical protein